MRVKKEITPAIQEFFIALEKNVAGFKDATKEDVFYAEVHRRLDERVDLTRILDKKDFNDLLGRLYHMPKKMWPVVLKELEKRKIAKDLGNKRNNNIYVEELLHNILENANKYYVKYGIF